MAHSVSRKAARLKPGLLYVGVDLALDSNQAKVVDERAKLLGKLGFPNTADGFAAQDLPRRWTRRAALHDVPLPKARS